jgi:UDP-N-acetyl-D-galactosamine dehydrogenase
VSLKENCPDIRNSRVIDVYNELKEFGIDVDVYDPWADKHEVSEEYGIQLLDQLGTDYEGILLCVSHNEFASLNIDALKGEDAVIYDIKSFWDKSFSDARL